MVARAYGVARQAQDVLDAQHAGRQKVALNRYAVAVAARDLKDGLQSSLLHLGRKGQWADAHVGALVVGYIHGVHQPAHNVRPGQGVR